ncbi:MAG: glutamine--fructose-6-phosphate transaminase (isomerizing) [Candidatus Levybacteria bacterium RIFCSPHIGHO2_12_FULL_38_12]|nr:MAG: glutamine--fructose-6-phosphate transaminase (isomerizing) [Candidatus Levybacteria bacterium RIFCSPHIGHO2_01_FULL_38_12]OGH21812.1 MAG: glutamine--fructose-6-phosphate transaminase (isomerizing) [Candidatus Levybacteria bacterium RIFCSPHIGHO2_02_FULL_37_18]OGH22531.1 MAG: glutamine--fructose-6-phosphate transaminase (isomerizing) [Candidatus Levybacteria bacterium RIFCSPHIGHO2_12_FULL_38_12]OGH33433.1 MAG: glutamine--fructose-6-phosphate transaminase (isomerizing) [Candidatus Levybacter
MCGIFAYVGSDNKASQKVLEGLKLLEYRGYDSWGIASRIQNSKFKIQNSKFTLEKHVGKIGNAELSSELSANSSQLALGHTRWATHGGVTVENAHPHLDCKKEIAVIHNGIVENFQEIKHELVKKRHVFTSQTDTEVIPHLIEEYLKKEGFASSVKDAFNRLKGLNAIVVAYAPSSEIIAAKTGSPLVMGHATDGFYIASDASGIIKHTKKVIFLKDNEMVILGKNIQLVSLSGGQKITPRYETINWKIEDEEKGAYKHFLIKEIHEQLNVIEYIALNSLADSNKLANLIDKAFGTFMLGCGTASYAALAGTYLFSRIAKKHVNFSIGSEFTYLIDYLTPESLVIPISQSGETIDVVSSIEHAKEKSSKIAAVVNVRGSTIYRQADEKILLYAGPEKAVVGTKSFTAMVAILLLSAFSLAKKQNEGKKLLHQASKNIRDILKENYIKEIKKVVEKIKKKEHIYIIGRGLSYAAALETSLKIKETSYMHAEGFAGGELKHGVIALIEKGTPCIVIAPLDETYDDIISNAAEIAARGGFIIGIGPKNNSVFDAFLPTEDCRDATFIPQVVIAQVLAYNLALSRGISDPDKPRNLAKSVTVK